MHEKRVIGSLNAQMKIVGKLNYPLLNPFITEFI